MAEKITTQEEDFSQWYQDIVLKARLADYSPVKGCMVIRPRGYAMWERIQREMDARIKKAGVQNAYFPLFIPESFLKKEAEHVEGFAPEIALVTHAGSKDLEERLVVRPTSETIINSMFSKWIQSYRDLPMKINQWANVVRWEMRTRLFLRTTEFLWQEGHTCHANADEAAQFALEMLDVYEEFAENVLAMPVLTGQKSEAEKFAGALRTYSIEAMLQDKKALQAGTTHDLSTHFSKAFETRFLDTDGTHQFVHQTSWGVSTRLIGAVIMIHSDNKGLVIPPRLAQEHVAIVPIGGKGGYHPEVVEAAEKIKAEIELAAENSKLPYSVGVSIDLDETKKPGWKFYEYEVTGMPIRIDLGPRDLEKKQVVLVRRDLGEKQFLPIEGLGKEIIRQLDEMQAALLEKARKLREDNSYRIENYSEFKDVLEHKGGFLWVSWCQSAECEAKVKEETKATSRCLPLDEGKKIIPLKQPCFHCGGTDHTVQAVFARAY
jgi:prolyl-tRNA synthetase